MLFKRYSTASPVSCELRLPRKNDHPQLFAATVNALSQFQSPFVSITTRPGEGAKALDYLANVPSCPILIHLTAWGYSIAQMEDLLKSLEQAKVRDVLAIRGDHPLTGANKGQLKQEISSALSLLSFLSDRGFNVYVACAPEGYPQDSLAQAKGCSLSKGIDLAVDALEAKADAGAKGAITQIIFDQNYLDKFLDQLVKRNIAIPISVGVMAPTHPSRLRNMAGVNQIQVPSELTGMAESFKQNPELGAVAVTDWTVNFIISALRSSSLIVGAHFFSFNEPQVVEQVLSGVKEKMGPSLLVHGKSFAS